MIKLGTRVLADADGRPARARLDSLVATAAALAAGGRRVVLVSSGAVGLGRGALGLDASPGAAALRQACAAVGQARLAELYRRSFDRHGAMCGQILVDQGAFDDRPRALELRAALEALLDRGVVPIVNQNDAVAGERLRAVAGSARVIFADNDRLAALVAGVLGADLLALLTDVPGIFDRDPKRHPDARMLASVDDFGALPAFAPESSAGDGRGGMASKVEAARIASQCGCQAVIASGRAPGALSHLVAGERVGTWIPARGTLAARHRWIAFATATRGTLHLDRGAVEALRERGASLLAAGVERVEGRFRGGDVVELRAADGTLVGRALSRLSAAAVRRRCGARTPLERRPANALIRRDRIVLLREPR